MAAISAATYAAYTGVAISAAAAGVGVRENQLSRKAAEEASAIKPPPLPTLGNAGAMDTAHAVQAANTQAQTAGATLLSGPEKETSPRPIGTVPPQGKSLLGA